VTPAAAAAAAAAPSVSVITSTEDEDEDDDVDDGLCDGRRSGHDVGLRRRSSDKQHRERVGRRDDVACRDAPPHQHGQ